MNIAIIGTRGVPNHYGGFEQFAEYLSQYLVAEGNSVTVYNSHSHPYKKSSWKGVQIMHKFDPEDYFGTFGQFLYDLNCILHCRKSQYDIILQLGYTSSSVWGNLLPKKSIVITNMDGLEWKRSKYNKTVQKFLLYAEKLAVKRSDFLIADSVGIQEYLTIKYDTASTYIPYGANEFTKTNIDLLNQYNLSAFHYNMLIARLEPENSIETILEGVKNGKNEIKFLVIGNAETKYGVYLKKKYKNYKNILFLGTIYDINILNNLRYYSENYFHGHTVGGTNPSLLEAMASGALICAHNNDFNKYILNDNAYYFNNSEDVSLLIKKNKKLLAYNQNKINNNYTKIKTIYSWDTINHQYSDLMKSIILNSKSEAVKKLSNHFTFKVLFKKFIESSNSNK